MKLFPAIFFLLISLLLVFSWFRFGLIYGGGDVGLPTYDPIRTLDVTRYIWWESAAPGTPVPQGLTSSPLHFVLSGLQVLGFTPLYLQASLFFLLLFFMGIGMYFLAVSILSGERKIYAYFAALFYMFNPYMMIQVWHRFIHNTFFLAAALPFLFIFFRSWIKTGRYISLLLFLLTNLLSVYLFGTIAFIVTVWILLFLVTVFEIFIPWQNRMWAFKLSLRFVLGCVFWVLLGSWWLIPTFTVGASLFSEQQTNDGSVITLLEISRQAALPYSLQMVNPYYLFETAELGDLYKKTFIRLVPWIFMIVISLGFVKSLRDRKFTFFGLFFLVAVFLSKGASTPFGYPFMSAFINLFFVGVLRNPFEKLGIFLPFAGSILFAIGIMVIYNFFSKVLNKHVARVIILGLLTAVLGFSWPMIQGTVFGGVGNPPFIKVPDSYQDANKWLNYENKDGNILHLPLTRQEGQTYKWEYGYGGVELSQLLFTSNPSISRGFNIQRVDDSLTALSLIFHKPNANKDQILSLLQAFNVRFIILHKDIQWLGTDIYNPLETEQILNSLDFLERKAEFGELVVYQLKEDLYKPKITLSDNPIVVYPLGANMGIWPWVANSSNSLLITAPKLQDGDFASSKELLVFPKKSLSYVEASASSTQSIIDALTTIPYSLTSSPLYGPLSKIQLFEVTGETEKANLDKSLILSGQTLAKIFGQRMENSELLIPLIDNYSDEINKVFSSKFNQSSLRFDTADWQYSETFQMHLILLGKLKQIQNQVIEEKITNLISKIKNSLIDQDLLPKYLQEEQQDFTGERVTHIMEIPKAGKYELLMTEPQVKELYPNNLKQVSWQINEKIATLSAKLQARFISFGELDFENGTYELTAHTPSSNNLLLALKNITFANNIKIIDDSTIQLLSTQNYSFFENEIDKVNGGDVLQFSFDADIEQGNRFLIQLVQDTDTEDKNNSKVKIPRVIFFIAKTPLNSGWQKYTVRFPLLSPTTQKARIRIVLEPNAGAVTPNSLTIKNMRVERVLNNDIVLRQVNKEIVNTQDSVGNVSFDQIDAGSYRGKISLKKPGFFVFKQTFHPGWRLKLISNNRTFYPNSHYLVYLYGNGWYIENPGEYEFELEFEPQRKVTIGIYLSIVGYFTILLLTITQTLKQKK